MYQRCVNPVIITIDKHCLEYGDRIVQPIVIGINKGINKTVTVSIVTGNFKKI